MYIIIEYVNVSRVSNAWSQTTETKRVQEAVQQGHACSLAGVLGRAVGVTRRAERSKHRITHTVTTSEQAMLELADRSRLNLYSTSKINISVWIVHVLFQLTWVAYIGFILIWNEVSIFQIWVYASEQFSKI
jgi:hypothetical protein